MLSTVNYLLFTTYAFRGKNSYVFRRKTKENHNEWTQNSREQRSMNMSVAKNRGDGKKRVKRTNKKKSL